MLVFLVIFDINQWKISLRDILLNFHILRLICVWILRILPKNLWAQLLNFVAIVLWASTFFNLKLRKIKLVLNLQIDY
jgi:hypothetical protein